MSCSLSEIAAKRLVAKKRLEARQKQLTQIQKSVAENFYTKPTTQAHSPKPSRVLQKNQKDNTKSPSGASLQKTTTVDISCTCEVVAETRFMVVPSKFHDQIISVFKSIPSKTYDPKTRNWSFLLTDYNLLRERFLALGPGIVIGAILPPVLKILTTKIEPVPDECLATISPVIFKALLPFQREGVLAAIAREGRILIADEMGLGKTYQALAVADFYRNDWPLLICTTASMRAMWQEKILTLLDNVAPHDILCMTSGTDYVGNVPVLIVSYGLMERCVDVLATRKYGVCIMDESHALKSGKAKQTMAAIALAKPAKRVILLSGTPALSRPLELYTQLNMISPKFMTYRQYTSRYCDGKEGPFGWNAVGQSNLTELKIIMNKKFMIRRTKEEVLKTLGNKRRETIVLDPSLVSQCVSKEVALNLAAFSEDLTKHPSGPTHDEVLLKFYHETALAKKKAVGAYMRKLAQESDEKFIVFAHHKVMMNSIDKCLKTAGVRHIRIDGSTNAEARQNRIDEFQTEPDCRAAVLSLKACNAGITMTAAQLVLFAELDWNPSTLIQAESRVHRIGQAGEVTCRYLMAANTADDYIWRKLCHKQEVLNKAGLFNDKLSDLDNFEHQSMQGFKSFVQSSAVALKLSPVKKDIPLASLLDDDDDEDLADLDF